MNEKELTDKRRLMREDLTMIMSQCYSRQGSVCKLHPVFESQKAINLILECLSKWNVKIVDEKAELPDIPPLTTRQDDPRYLDGWIRDASKKTQQDMLHNHHNTNLYKYFYIYNRFVVFFL